MHEEALLRDLLGKTLEVAARAGDVRVTQLRVWVGALAHVDGGQFTARFHEMARGTAAADAVIALEVSADPADPRAQGLVLRDVRVTDRDAPKAEFAPPRAGTGGAP